MFPVVPCMVAFFAPLQAANSPIVTPYPPPDPHAVVRFATDLARQHSTGLQSPTIQLDSRTADALGIQTFGNVPPPQIAVPDESRTRLAPQHGHWWLGEKASPLPEGLVASTPPPEESLFVRVRKQVRDESLAPATAATLLVASAVENERVGHHTLAREDLDMALERDPTHAEARRMRAKRRHEAGDYHGALRDAEAELAARPTDPATRYDHARMLIDGDRPGEAHRELTSLIREYPGRGKYYASRAAASFRLGHFWDGDLDSEIAVELAPADPACRLLRMKLCLGQGDLQGAYDQYQAGFRGDPIPAAGSPELRVLVEFLTLAHEHFEMAPANAEHLTTQLDWMVKACPDFNPPRYLLAVEYLNGSRPDLAEQVATEALERDPTDARAFHLRGVARAALARPDAALDFATSLGLAETAEVRAELVKLHRAAGRRAEARKLAEAGIELHPACGACRQFLADDDLRRGDFAAAERYATCALWLAHDRADATAARLTRLLARLAQLDLGAAADDYAKLPINEDVSVPVVALGLK